MHCNPTLSRLLYWYLLMGASLFSQCYCKDPNQGKGNNSKNQKPEQEEHDQDHTGLKPKPPKPNPPPVGPPDFNFIAEGPLQVMESMGFSDGGSARCLVEKLRELKEDPSKVDLTSRDGYDNGGTILHEAVKYGVNWGEKIIKEVLKLQGVDINAQDDNGYTPLHLTILKGTYDKDSGEPTFLKTLLEHGANIDVPDSRGNTVLHVAIGSGSLRHLQALLLQATPAQLNQPNLTGLSPLHVAVINGNLEAVKELIQAGADMNMKTPDGKNVLHLAAARGHFDIVKALVAADANKTSKTSDGKTALQLTQDARIINFLGGVTPPVPVVEDSVVDVMEVGGYPFLANKLRHPDQDINGADPTEDGTTALHQAAGLGNIEALKFLLAKDANVNLFDNKGQTALHKAAKAGHLEVVKTLLAHGAYIDSKDLEGCTPALLAGNKLDVLEVLVDYGANVNASLPDGRTFLYLAARVNSLPLLQYLLSKKALVDLRGGHTQTPLYVAAAKGYDQTVKALIEAGADVNKPGTTSPKRSTLSLAIGQKNIAVVKMLLQAGAEVGPEDVDNASTKEMKQLLQDKLTKVN